MPHSDQVGEGHVPLAQETKAVVARATKAARDVGRGDVSTAILLLAILQEPTLRATKLFAEQGVSADKVAAVLAKRPSQEQLISQAEANGDGFG
ncbi:Clp protease N-terminal domain-containing protein [Actinospica acidithermotolerans]|uniref:Clp protease N-terminal domain-containing protein n=1 Tax=Actinospica acidithermotolerans TaxID=2828514 RepID=UPI002012A676|nr:Clp protease N-terminal domain-containing protein [Actinospica acidithermotolerans]